jgi:EF-1 guanine nucleotide exchange domain
MVHVLTFFIAKLVPVGYGIKKLQINAVVVDDLVSVDDLEEKITSFEDYVQSMVFPSTFRSSSSPLMLFFQDVAAFNKI